MFSRNENELGKKSDGDETKRVACPSHSKTILHDSVPCDNQEEIDILHNTIGDLQQRLREREKKIEVLCQKYMYLRTNKKKMVIRTVINFKFVV